ncbi:hypothetical protein J1782_24100 [Rahnella sp. BCC 1045]|uniref:hypothetical protein n=1 Tax=Rahnella sp. BCC 1045 TaxID=2816251 RepID=UPI001C252131|nr:hypothetical protein [Rahnella sp. BCC 1045]MBU9822979.1 hypothetical protein [Rahnella sp. BCC 1045]
MTIVKKNHLSSVLLISVILSIMLLISANARASTAPGAVKNTLEEAPNTQACAHCVSYDVSVWMFTPTRPDALRNVLQSLNALPERESDEVEGQRVISPDKSAVTADTFRQSGTLEPLAFWHAMSYFGEPLPLELVSSAGAFRAVLNTNVVPVHLKPTSKTFTQKLMIFSDYADSSFQYQTLLNFQLAAGLPIGPDNEAHDVARSSGRVLLKNGSAVLNINRVGKSYMIWLVHLTDSRL